MAELVNVAELVTVLQAINAQRLQWHWQDLPAKIEASLAEQRIEALFHPAYNLAVYGTLAPGEVNAGEMAEIPGTWHPGRVRGVRYALSAGAATGYPGMVWDKARSPQPVQLFQSAELPRHWLRLDEFEGEGYVRILVPVEWSSVPSAASGKRRSGEGKVMAIANLYALRPESVPPEPW